METAKSIKEIIDVNEEDDTYLSEKLAEISTKHEAVLMACIAPYVGLKISPTKTVKAQMGISEEFAVETAINQIEAMTDNRKLMLLVNSPGGLVQSSYKIAHALRKTFNEIIVFVPHIAASGGTLLALTGNKIVMGMMSHLSPLDPHGESDEGVIPANSVIDAHQFVTTLFDDVALEDAPYTYKVLADKFDGIDIRDALASLSLMEEYIREILDGVGYSKEESRIIGKRIVRGFKTHDEVINFDKAKSIGLNVVSHNEYATEWKVLREWLAKYMLQSTDKHVIRFTISEKIKKQE